MKKILLIFGLTAGIVLGAKMRIPVEPVPFTMQTLFVLLLCFKYPPIVSTGAVILYLLLGCFLPVFSGENYGKEVLLGPTSGYLLAFPVAAYLCSYSYQRIQNKNWGIRFGLAASAHLLILCFGVIGLILTTPLSFSEIMLKGWIVLLPGAVIKSALVALVK
ncbi:MAG: biotin transporter BioY [Bacteroidia bacterium]|nr:biotin transporter BioY [Bacteroidia bacterium]MBP9723564.1 biotin transporter BioY [Bacteroidia bacterium]